MSAGPTIYLEYFGNVHPYFGLGVKILTALFMGALIGIDRELKMKPAGLKTNVLICLGATLFTSISMINHHGMSNVDPNRVAAQIVSGIGFLGAGAIIHGKGNVSGLTTAATIWTVAAIGFTIGSGYPIMATIFTVTVLIVLIILNPLFAFLSRNRYFHLEVYTDKSYKDSIKGVMIGEGLKVKKLYQLVDDDNEGHFIIHGIVKGSFKNLSRIADHCRKLEHVKKARFYAYDEDYSSKGRSYTQEGEG